MKSIHVLWVDDEWLPGSSGEPGNAQFDEWIRQWHARLVGQAMELKVTRSASPDVLDRILRTPFNALILDYGLAVSDDGYANAVELLGVMQGVPRAAEIPVVILSKLAPQELEHLAMPQLQGVFEKTDSGASAVGDFLESLGRPRSLNLLLMSDLHVGFLPARGGVDGSLHHDRFFRSLCEKVGTIAGQVRIDGVLISGDFAWHDPTHDLTNAAVAVDQIVRAAGVSSTSGLLFCPGNHDLCYDRGDTGDWVAFRQFVEKLGIGSGDQFFVRFVNAWNPKTRRLGDFLTQSAVMTVVVNHAARFAFVGLNSCKPTGKKYGCIGSIDADQWDDVEKCLEQVPSDYFRIAALHHPLFSPPDGFWKADQPMTNQGSLLRYLTKHGFSLVVHGHTHFAGVHAHHARALNRPGHSRPVTASSSLLAVSCPSVLAEPDPNTPNRQFFLARMNQPMTGRGDWDFRLDSWVFEPSGCIWEPGESVPEGEFALVKPAPGRR